MPLRVGKQNIFADEITAFQSIERAARHLIKKAYSNHGESGQDIERVLNSLNRLDRVRRRKQKK